MIVELVAWREHLTVGNLDASKRRFDSKILKFYHCRRGVQKEYWSSHRYRGGLDESRAGRHYALDTAYARAGAPLATL